MGSVLKMCESWGKSESVLTRHGHKQKDSLDDALPHGSPPIADASERQLMNALATEGLESSGNERKGAAALFMAAEKERDYHKYNFGESLCSGSDAAGLGRRRANSIAGIPSANSSELAE